MVQIVKQENIQKLKSSGMVEGCIGGTLEDGFYFSGRAGGQVKPLVMSFPV